MKTVFYSDDVNLLLYWEQALEKKCRCVDDLETLYKLESSLIILNYSSCLGECKSILQRLNDANNRVLVLHRTPLLSTAKEVLKLGAYGYGNALMREHFIVAAINAIEEDMIWLYPEFTSQLIMEIPTKKSNDELLDILSSREKDVAILLRDGFSYKEIAQKLNITPRTVKAHAHQTYVKLQVKDRLSLALILK